MKFIALVLMLVPSIAFAESTCYSPSDCAHPQICSSLIDNIFPGTCVTKPGGDLPLYELQNAVSSASSSSSTSLSTSSSTSSSSAAASVQNIAKVRIVESSSSSSSSSSASTEAPEKNATVVRRIGGSITNAIKWVFCLFFC